MAGSRVVQAFGRRWSQMQYMIGQTGQPLQAAPLVEIGEQRPGTGSAPLGSPAGIAQHGIDAIAVNKAGKSPAGHVSAADNEYFLHGCIVADQ